MGAGNVNPAGSDPIRGPQPLIGGPNIQGDNRTPSSSPSVDGLGGIVQEPPIVPSPPPSGTVPVPPPPGSPGDREARVTARGNIIASLNLGEAATSFLSDAVNRRHPLS